MNGFEEIIDIRIQFFILNLIVILSQLRIRLRDLGVHGQPLELVHEQVIVILDSLVLGEVLGILNGELGEFLLERNVVQDRIVNPRRIF